MRYPKNGQGGGYLIPDLGNYIYSYLESGVLEVQYINNYGSFILVISAMVPNANINVVR